MRCLNKVGNYCFDRLEELKEEKITNISEYNKYKNEDNAWEQYERKEILIKGQMDAYADILTRITDLVKSDIETERQ